MELCATIAFLVTVATPVSAQAALTFTASASNADATPTTKAGTHPYQLKFKLSLQSPPPGGGLREAAVHLPAGLLVNPTAISECSPTAFATPRSQTEPSSLSGESCPNSTQAGVITVDAGGTVRSFGLFLLVPPHGSAAAFGASPFGTPLVFRTQLRESDYGLDLLLAGVPQSLDLRSIALTLWGTPWLGEGPTGHDPQRGNCLDEATGGSEGECLVFGSAPAPESQIKSILTMPTFPCGAHLAYTLEALTWGGGPEQASVQGPTLAACNKPLTIPGVQLMTDAAAARTGLAFNLRVNDGGGILNPAGIARPPLKKAILALPEGLTINPSLGAGLGACAAAEFARETATTEPGTGCPNAAKIGDLTLDGVLGIAEPLHGALYLARPRENPYGTLLGLYMIARSPRRGLAVKSLGKLDLDPRSGAIVATFDELPRLLYTNLSLTLREGQRSTLVSPPGCGLYTSALQFSSWAEPSVFKTEKSAFAINRAVDGGPCPALGALPFHPGLLAGSLNPSAGAYTPMYLRMTRTDSEQEITSYSATLPPGLLAKLAGVASCPDAAIDAARSRPGAAELAEPSCPPSALIGRTLAGYGVGGVLAYAPGNLYLAGPYRGAPLSTVAIDSALIGPFDLGTVIVRSAIRVDPTTAQASIDSSASDPIPHILGGIPLHLRDIRVHVNRPRFTLNPTSCDAMSVDSLLTGAGADLFSAVDDSAATSTQRYQLLGCSALDFRPRLRFNLRVEGSRRFPALRSEYRPRPADANSRFVSVTLPRSLFVAQSHLREICTRAQFAAEACPSGSIYGRARAFTPLLEQPLEGPVYLRSADPLPDLVFDLRGQGGLRIEVAGRIDTVHRATRVTFPVLPDAPLTRFVLSLRGGRRSLLELTQNACSARQLANARMIGHNNLGAASKPAVRVRCRDAGKRTSRKRRRGER